MSDRLIYVLLVDDEPIYRLGLAEILNHTQGFSVMGVQGHQEALAERLSFSPDLIILDPATENLYQLLGEIYPETAILLHTYNLLSDQDCLLAQRAGARGYCRKSIPLEDLLDIFRRVAQGESYWGNLSGALVAQRQAQVRQEHWLIRLATVGIRDINSTIEQVRSNLQQPQISAFDWWYWQGRKRELKAAGWLVRQILPVDVPPEEEIFPITTADLEYPSLPQATELPILTQSRPLGTTVILERILSKLQNPLIKEIPIPLEIDILKAPRQKELLYIVFEQVRSQLDELRFLEINPQELMARKKQISEDIWEKSSQRFLSIFYPEKTLATQEEITQIILTEIQDINRDILKKIPFISDIFAYFLYNQKLIIDNVDYETEAPESLARAEIILENLIIQIANAVVALILNNYSDTEQVKLVLYSKDFVSTRQIAKFRNDISWKYRSEKYWQEPQWIFESSYPLLYIDSNKIARIFVYAPRQSELARLNGWRWFVTIILETRDAISPQAQAIFSWLGSGVVYILTQVIGRGIGLIARGILQGVGNTWQDLRYGRSSQRDK